MAPVSRSHTACRVSPNGISIFRELRFACVASQRHHHDRSHGATFPWLRTPSNSLRAISTHSHVRCRVVGVNYGRMMAFSSKSCSARGHRGRGVRARQVPMRASLAACRTLTRTPRRPGRCQCRHALVMRSPDQLSWPMRSLTTAVTTVSTSCWETGLLFAVSRSTSYSTNATALPTRTMISASPIRFQPSSLTTP